MNELMTDTLLDEYETLIMKLGIEVADEQIIRALMEHGDWTEKGARTLVALAREQGVFVLRNALALAGALRIEDGTSGA